MHFQIQYNANKCCETVIKEQLQRLSIPFELNNMIIAVTKAIPDDVYQELRASLEHYGIEINDNPKRIFVQKIKDAISQIISNHNILRHRKTSVYLTETLQQSYSYIANVFSEITYISIENYIIIQKIERAKQMILENKYTLTEMAWQLNYSSVAHLSNQFKNKIGLTPTMFQRIMEDRNNQIYDSIM
ncbi:helix-turn-helix domain-containing protein [Flavobacterium aestuarii]|uniref:helix-turn-helix domain-containing protein n=1 Tax=Flavobacterium aestuarii TaxID=3149227 RepID=UPI0032B3B8B4